ncbi:hypothetical protein B5F77_00510 [Parabacteroides sp. An277]|nr:hypothetical protein B5F77_00510 [Parabacteroides sp. An277]
MSSGASSAKEAVWKAWKALLFLKKRCGRRRRCFFSSRSGVEGVDSGSWAKATAWKIFPAFLLDF